MVLLMTYKTMLGLMFTLILVIPTTSLGVYAEITPDAPQDGKQLTIKGATSTTSSVLFKKWSSSYQGLYPGIKTKLDTSGTANVAYQISKKYEYFGVTDVPLSADQANITPHTIVIPSSVEIIAIVYNLPEFKQSGLKLTGSVLADIYLGKIIYWDNSKIHALNPEIKLPHARIVPLHRLEASGLTYTFTDYLSSVSKDWKTQIGKGTTVWWKVGFADQQLKYDDILVRNLVNTPYSIGYTDLGNTVKYKTTYAVIENLDGTNFVVPSLETATYAAHSASKYLPESDDDWSNVSIVNSPGTNSYPIVALSSIWTYQQLDKINGIDKDTAKALVHQIYWDVTEGQQGLSSLKLAPLPAELQELDKRGLSKISFKGSQLFAYDGFLIKPET